MTLDQPSYCVYSLYMRIQFSKPADSPCQLSLDLLSNTVVRSHRARAPSVAPLNNNTCLGWVGVREKRESHKEIKKRVLVMHFIAVYSLLALRVFKAIRSNSKHTPLMAKILPEQLNLPAVFSDSENPEKKTVRNRA